MKVRLNVTKTFKHKNTRIWSIIGRRNWRKKRSVGLATTGKKRGEEDIVISQAIRILNIVAMSWSHKLIILA